MADLFELPDLVSYMQVAELDAATAALGRRLATTDIRNAAGASRYDALDAAGELGRFESIALDLAKRKLFNLNPEGLRTVQIDDYSETRASETLGPPYLTAEEQAAVRGLAGRSSAFSIRPAPPTRQAYSYCTYR